MQMLPLRFIIWAAATTISLATIAFSAYFLQNLRESALSTAQEDLTRHSLTLSEQADRSFKSLELVIASVADYALRKPTHSQADFSAALSTRQTYDLLTEKLSGLPQVDAITIINASGKLLNFSRYWPIPEVNVSDRDYYKALAADPTLSTFVSTPVRNRGTGTWTIYLARRLNGPQGEFIGLVLGAMTLQYFEDFYGATWLGPGSAVSLMRSDGTMLVRYPAADEVGKVFENAPRIMGDGRKGLVRELSPIDGTIRIKAAHRLQNFPLFILVTQAEESVLGPWRRMRDLLLGLSISFAVLVFALAALIERKLSQQVVAARLQRERIAAEMQRAEAEANLLRERQKAAEAASKAKSSFLAVMSHEIRTPMNAVLGLAASLLESDLTADQRKLVQTIHDSGDSLLDILNDILDYSRLEGGTLQLEEIPFSPNHAAHAVMELLRPRAEAKGLVLKAESGSDLPNMVLGDVGRLRQILINLVSNAVKFTQSGEITVACRLVGIQPGNAEIEWTVRDTGIGIAADKLGLLFQDYVQADCSINRRFGGSGLGLSICKRLVEAMKGTIDVTSEIGVGTTMRVRVSLPLATETAVEPAVENADARLREHIGTLGRPLRVLVTDDNATNRLIAARMLNGLDAVVRTAGDGAEAVAAAAETDFDVILMDVRMPEMDGIEATKQIRKRGQSVPVIGFTANAFKDDVETCLAAGMSGFVAKPARKAALLAAIYEAVTTPRPRAATEARGEDAAQRDDSAQRPLIDQAVWHALADELGEEGFSEAFAAFVAEADQRLKTLASGRTTDRTVVAREAHTIKGIAATFGFERLSKLAAELEKTAASVSAAEIAQCVQDMQRAFAEGRTALEPQLAEAA